MSFSAIKTCSSREDLLIVLNVVPGNGCQGRNMWAKLNNRCFNVPYVFACWLLANYMIHRSICMRWLFWFLFVIYRVLFSTEIESIVNWMFLGNIFTAVINCRQWRLYLAHFTDSWVSKAVAGIYKKLKDTRLWWTPVTQNSN